MNNILRNFTLSDGSCDCNELSKKIDELRSDTDSYRTQINIAGGVCAGLLIVLIIVMIYLHIRLGKMKTTFERQLKEVDPLRGRVIISGEPSPSRTPEPVRDRFKQTTGNFDGLSPTDFTHFDFPSTNRSVSADDSNFREPKTPNYGRW